jgi:hypothetical protein
LEKRRDAWLKQVQAMQCDVVADFEAKFSSWKNCQWQDDFWRHDWAGKEILHWLRIAMTNRFGWPNAQSGARETMEWTMSRDKREAQDRPIEAALRPRMIDQFLSVMPSLAAEIREEFAQMKTVIMAYRV